MSGKWKRYPAYRESGVEWVGSIPKHWDLQRLKFWVAPSRPITYGIVQCGPHIDAGVPYIRPVDMSDEHGVRAAALQRTSKEIAAAYQRSTISSGDLVISIGPSFGKVMEVPGELAGANLTQGTARVACRFAGARRFLFWALRSPNAHHQWRAGSGGATFSALTLDLLAETTIPAPPEAEWRPIAAFLDRETAKIDALVAKKERLIELLQEKRTALISHAVTRGLNPNAPLRDSGIPWIGNIPTHWKLKRFRHVTTRVDVGIAEAATHAYADEGVPILRSTNVRANRLLLDDILRVQPWFAERNRTKYLLKDDILTVRTGNAGVSAVVPEHLHRSQCFTMLMSTLRKRQDARFYCYFLNASSGQTVFAIEAWGTAQANISVPILKEVPVVEPPYEEQTAIVAFIEGKVAKLDALMAKVRTAIDRLQEYRTALISAAVTGQIDVREEARP